MGSTVASPASTRRSEASESYRAYNSSDLDKPDVILYKYLLLYHEGLYPQYHGHVTRSTYHVRDSDRVFPEPTEPAPASDRPRCNNQTAGGQSHCLRLVHFSGVPCITPASRERR